MKGFIRKYYFEISSVLLGAALSGLFLSFYYNVNNDKKWADCNLIASGFCVVPALIIARLGRKWELESDD